MPTLSLTFVRPDGGAFMEEGIRELLSDFVPIEGVALDGNSCTVWFRVPDVGEEAAAWEVMCRIAAAFPGAVVSTGA